MSKNLKLKGRASFIKYIIFRNNLITLFYNLYFKIDMYLCKR